MRASAILEYKHEYSASQFPSHPVYMALVDLGDRAQLPVFVARYAHDFSWWKVVPMNSVARRILPGRRELNERGFVTLLYQLRGLKVVPEQVFEQLEQAI
jgi:hypothetical protein